MDAGLIWPHFLVVWLLTARLNINIKTHHWDQEPEKKRGRLCRKIGSHSLLRGSEAMIKVYYRQFLNLKQAPSIAKQHKQWFHKLLSQTSPSPKSSHYETSTVREIPVYPHQHRWRLLHRISFGAIGPWDVGSGLGRRTFEAPTMRHVAVMSPIRLIFLSLRAKMVPVAFENIRNPLTS